MYIQPEDERIECPGCEAKNYDPDTFEEMAYIHRTGCPVDYEPAMGVELPDGSRALFGHEVDTFRRGADWARKKIAENLRKRADAFERTAFPVEAAAYRRCAEVVEESEW